MAISQEIVAFSAAGLSLQEHKNACIYCASPLETVNEEEHIEHPGSLISFDKWWTQRMCPECGWWTLDYLARDCDYPLETIYNFAHVFGILERFDVSSTEVPVKELRRYLVEKFDGRFDIAPRKLEELVADLFRDHGFKVELTSYSVPLGGDGSSLGSRPSGPGRSASLGNR